MERGRQSDRHRVVRHPLAHRHRGDDGGILCLGRRDRELGGRRRRREGAARRRCGTLASPDHDSDPDGQRRDRDDATDARGCVGKPGRGLEVTGTTVPRSRPGLPTKLQGLESPTVKLAHFRRIRRDPPSIRCTLFRWSIGWPSMCTRPAGSGHRVMTVFAATRRRSDPRSTAPRRNSSGTPGDRWRHDVPFYESISKALEEGLPGEGCSAKLTGALQPSEGAGDRRSSTVGRPPFDPRAGTARRGWRTRLMRSVTHVWTHRCRRGKMRRALRPWRSCPTGVVDGHVGSAAAAHGVVRLPRRDSQ